MHQRWRWWKCPGRKLLLWLLLGSLTPPPRPPPTPPPHGPKITNRKCKNRFRASYFLTVLQDALFGTNTALGACGVWFPLAILHIDMHVEFPAEHGHLGLSQQSRQAICGHLEDRARGILLRCFEHRGLGCSQILFVGKMPQEGRRHCWMKRL